MSRYHSHIKTALKIIETYTGNIPFANFIKQFFAAEKKYGSKDRKQIASLCFNYFRLGFGFSNYPAEERMMLATFLCETEPTEFMQRMQPQWNDAIALPFKKKLSLLSKGFSLADIFPFSDLLSNDVDPEAFCRSFLVQPDLFLRIRHRVRSTTFKKLEKFELAYRLVGENCIQLPPATKLENFFIMDKEVVVQDYNSQQVLNYLPLSTLAFAQEKKQRQPGLATWDCCAASGGKSILLYDILNRKIDLTVSDIRGSVVLKLQQRFESANIKTYKYFIADIAIPDFKSPASGYELIICDAPCTGSGTWSRTPEQLHFFTRSILDEYCEKQRRIITNVIPQLQNGGLFFYITCSVFKKENEEQAAFIQDKFNCRLLHQQLLRGYDKKADSMFVAVFQK